MDPSEVAKTPLAQAVLADVMARFRQHRDEDTLPRGPRGIFYDLRPSGMGNGVIYRKKHASESITAYHARYGTNAVHIDYVGNLLGRARRADLIFEWWVADGHTPGAAVPFTYDDAEEFSRSVVTSARRFKLDPQRFQPVFIEVLCEAADLTARLARVSRPYGVPVYASAGMDAIKPKRRMGERAQDRSVPTVVLQVGDCDKRGREIFVAVAEDATAWADDVENVYEDGTPLDELLDDQEADVLPALSFYRLALSPEQGKALDILDDDGDAEADAIPVPTLDGWLREAIEGLQDSACRTEWAAKQEAERERLPEVVRDALDSANGGA
jgi:hypothetical protein